MPESGLHDMLTDDRLANYYSEVKCNIQDELTWLEALPTLVWSRLAALAGAECTRFTLYDSVLHSAHVSLAYMQERVFKVVEGTPGDWWKGHMCGVCTQAQQPTGRCGGGRNSGGPRVRRCCETWVHCHHVSRGRGWGRRAAE